MGSIYIHTYIHIYIYIYATDFFGVKATGDITWAHAVNSNSALKQALGMSLYAFMCMYTHV